MTSGDLEIGLHADIAHLQRDMDDARRIVGDATAAMGRAAEKAMLALGGITGTVDLARIVDMSDAYAKMTAQLRLATDGTHAYDQACADVKRIANSSQSDLAATGALYASLSRATKDLGTSQQSVADMTEAVNLGLKISGAGAQESSGAILQLSQALAAGALRGDEFNSVAEAAPRLMTALADNIGVPVGALRAMAEQGKLTGEVVAKALPQALGQLRAEAGQIETISGAFTVLKNNVMEFTGVHAQASGVVTVLTGGIGLLANNLGLLAGAAATVAAVKLGNWLDGTITKATSTISANRQLAASTLATAEANATGTAQASLLANARLAEVRAATLAASGETQLALTTNALIPAQVRAAAAAEAHAVAMGELTVAQRAASLGASAASTVMGALGGPVGALITVLGLAAAAWSWYKDKQDEAARKSKEEAGQTTGEIIEGLEKQNEKMRQRIELAKKYGEIDVKQESPELDRLTELMRKMNALKAQGANISPGDAVSLISYEGEFNALKKVTEQNKEYRATLESTGKASSDLIEVRQRLSGVNQQYLDDLTKLKTALDKGSIGQAEYVAAVSKLARETFEGSTAGKQLAQSLDAQAAAIQRATEAQGLRSQREQEHIQFLKNSGRADDETTIRSAAGAQVKDLNDQIAAQQRLMEVESRRQMSAEQLAQKQAESNGKIANLRTQIDNTQKKRDEDLFLLEQQRYRQAVNNAAAVIESEQGELASLRQQTQAQIDDNEKIGLSQQQIAGLTAKRLEEAAARKDSDAVIAEGLDLTGERADRIRAEAQAIRERAAAVVDGAAKQAAYDKTIQDLSAMVDIMSALDGAAQSAAQGMANAFGSVGQAIGGMMTVLTGYERKQAEVAAKRASATNDAHGDPTKIAQANQMAAEASAQAHIKSYGDMAGAAKGFFNESSKGYKVLGGIEKAYRAAEMAMALESMAKKIFFKETEVAANTTLNATKLTGEATTTAASTGLAATEASAWGITAVVKAIASMPFPLNLAAGAATLAAVVAVGAKIFGGVGGSGQSVTQERQASQGTGTVLGDPSAKSESIKRAIELSASNSSTQINYLSGMLTALQSIQSNIAGFASEVLRTTDVTNPNVGGLNTNNGGATTVTKTGLVAAGAMAAGPLGALAAYAVNKIPAIGNMLGKISTSIFGGKQSLDDSGITMDKTSLASILANGAHAKSYADITTSGGWFRSDKHDTKMSSLDADANRQFTAIIASLADSVKQAGMLLGMNGDAFSAKLNTFVVDIGKISLKNLKGEDLKKALESVFSKLGDQMAQFGVDGLQQFQKVGEGYLETLMRVATDYAKVDASLQSIGKTFGATGVSSIAARESLIALLGGIDGFQSKTADYASNFLTKAQQLAPVAAYVTQQLTSMNLGWVQTREQFAGVVAGLDLTTTAGQQTYAALMNLESAFAATHEAIADTTKSAQDIADERKNLQDQLDQMTMTSAQLLAKQRDALDDSNKALFDQVQAAKAVKDAQDAAKTSLGNFVNQMKSFASTAKGLNNSLALGSLSTLTPEQQYVEAGRQFDQTRRLAAAGDATAQGNLQSAEQTFLQMSQKINGGDSQYSSDLATVMQANDQLAQWATQSVDVAQASLDALNDSSATLTDISATLTAIAQGVQYLPAALGGQDSPAFTQSSTQIDYSRMGTMDMAPLVAEVKALREEVKGLRAEALKRTGDLIQAGEASAEKAAEIVVEGVRNAATDSAWAASNSKRTVS